MRRDSKETHVLYRSLTRATEALLHGAEALFAARMTCVSLQSPFSALRTVGL